MSDASPGLGVKSDLTFQEFYQQYLRGHAAPWCKRLHYLGPLLGLAYFVTVIYLKWYWLLVLLPVPIYSCSWLGHWVGGTWPEVFGQPWWSFRAYWRMVLGR